MKQNAQFLLPPDFSSMNQTERRTFFRNTADKIEEQRTVVKELTEDQKFELKDDLTQLSLRRRDIEEEKKQVNQSFTSRLKEVKSDLSTVLNSLNTGFEHVVDDVYWLYDTEQLQAYGFTADGQCVDSRRMTPTERQTFIKPEMTVVGGN
jgi:membrane-associated HD superfamily phosphohydrolase